MDIFTAIVVFTLVWWVVIFTVLPWGNKPLDNPEVGHDRSSPANPRIRQKLIITTILSLVITVTIIAVIHTTKFSFREAVSTWSVD